MTKTTAHPLAHLVPSSTYASRYESRYHNGVEDLVILEEAHRNGGNVLIEGPTGPGKTMLAYAYAARHNLPLVSISCNGAVEPGSFFGGWKPQPDRSYRFVPGDALLAITFGGVLYLDEANMSPPDISAVLHELTDMRRSVSVPEATGSDFPTYLKAHPDFFLIATMNEGKAYRGTKALNAAFADRFADTIRFDYVPEVEKKILSSAALVDVATDIRARIEVGDLSTPLSTRALVEFEARVRNPRLGWAYAVGNLSRKFRADEREVVTKVFELNATAIKNDLGVPVEETDEEPF